MTETKKCRECKKEKPITEFYKGVKAKKKQYYLPNCIECIKPIRKAERDAKKAADPDRYMGKRAKAKAYRDAHPELQEQQKAEKKEMRRLRMANDPAYRDRTRATHLERVRKWQAQPANKQKIIDYEKKRSQDPKAKERKQAYSLIYGRKRRAEQKAKIASE